MTHPKSAGATVMATPNVIPMADVMLVLLIIFMVVTPFLQPGAPVDLAKVNNPIKLEDADKDDAVIVTVTRVGEIYVGRTRADLNAVAAQVNDLISGRTDKTVFVKSDARAKYGDVVQLVDELQSSGVDRVGLLTEKLERGEDYRN